MALVVPLTAGAKDFLIDCLALPREDVRRLLAPVLSNPRICKVQWLVRLRQLVLLATSYSLLSRYDTGM